MTRDKKFYSFDIFDTLVTRTTVNSKGIFQIMEYILRHDDKYRNFDNYIKDNFTMIRQNAFAEIKKEYSFDNIEPKLEDIYDRIANHNGLNLEQKQCLLNLELQTEKNNLCPIPKNIELLKRLVNNKYKVILISDMYLSSEQIRDLLLTIDNIFTNISIEVSCEWNSTKQSGNIYPKIKKKYNIEYDKWIHYGDNLIGDIKNAEFYGINANLVKKHILQPFEETILRNQDNVEAQIYIGLSKNCCLSDNKINSKFKFACSFAAPYSFLKDSKVHVIRFARSNKITKFLIG